MELPTCVLSLNAGHKEMFVYTRGEKEQKVGGDRLSQPSLGHSRGQGDEQLAESSESLSRFSRLFVPPGSNPLSHFSILSQQRWLSHLTKLFQMLPVTGWLASNCFIREGRKILLRLLTQNPLELRTDPKQRGKWKEVLACLSDSKLHFASLFWFGFPPIF